MNSGDLDQNQYDAIISHHSRALQKPAKAPQSGVNRDAINSWHKRLRQGLLSFDTSARSRSHERHEASEQPEIDEDVTAAPSRKASKIESVPNMEDVGIAIFEKCLQESKCFLEYGSGGSTLMASRLEVGEIISVNSDKECLAAVQSALSSSHSNSKLHSIYVDVGPTGEWSRPIDEKSAHLWPNYCSQVWSYIQERNTLNPDLILVKGRFRPACLLTSMAFAKPGTRILFDDYYDRPQYHIVERHFKPTGGAGRMAEFIVPHDVSATAFLADLLTLSTNRD